MAQLNDNISTSWDGLLGSEVQDAIKEQFSSIVSDINTGIKNIEFSEYTDTNGDPIPGQVKYVITYLDGSTSGEKVFSLILQATYTAYLDKFETNSDYIIPGNDLTVNYGFHVLNGTEQVSGEHVTLQFTVSNGSYSHTFDSFTTSKSSLKNYSQTGSYTINGDYLKEGVNTVSVKLTYVDATGAISNGKLNDNVNSSFTILSFNLKLKATCDKELNLIITDTTSSISFDLNFYNGLNKLIDSNYGLTGKIHTRLFNSNGTVIQSVNTSVLTESLQNANGGVSSTHEYICYLQSYIEFEDVTIYSNVVKFQFIGGDLSSETITRYAYKIDEYSNYNGAVINTSANYQLGTQYDTVEFPVYTYIPSDKTFTITDQDNKLITTISLTKPTELSLLLITGDEKLETPWSYQLTNQNINTITISDGSIPVTFNITTTNIGSDMTLPSNPTLRLSANGKSGKDEFWGESQDSEGNSISLTTFNNFDWSANGWIDNALVVNNNAKAVINLTPCSKTIASTASSTTVIGRSISFRLKTSNENTEEELIKCYNENSDGFIIYPQKAVIYKGTQSIETQFSTDNSEKEITFVWYNTTYGGVSIIYVNGTSLMVLTSGTSTSNLSKISITSNETTLYLYNVEVFERALNFNEVQALYCLHKADNISDYITSNGIFSGSIGLENNGQKVTIESLPVGSTYMLIKADPKGQSRFWEKINKLEATKKMTDGKEIETKSWRILAGNTYLITKVADGEDADEFNFFADRITISGQGTSSMSYPVKNFRIYFGKKITPSVDTTNKDGFIVKGTGSQDGFGDAYEFTEGTKTWIDGEYGKTTKFISGSKVTGTDYVGTNETTLDFVYQLTSDAIPANVFCLKADYAESSGVHNTGFARLSNYILENSTSIQSGESSKLPINAIKNDYIYTCRLSIDGRALYLFFQDNDGNVVYHGKYNLNNEKASPEVFGFQPYPINKNSYSKYNSYISYHSETIKDPASDSDTLIANPDKNTCKGTGIKSYFDLDVVKNECQVLKNLFNVSDDEYEKGHMYYKDSSGELQINPTECWEFSTNDASAIKHRELLGNYLSQIGAFTFPYTVENNTATTGYPYSGNVTYNGLNPFTEPYVKDNEGAGLAWINTEQAWEPRFPDDDNINDFYENGGTPYLLRSVYKWVHKHNVYCWPEASKAEHAAIFAKDLHKYFNVNYLIKYYVLTKLFINADQRVKNCMLAFYCDPNVTSNTDSETPTGHMRGFYIFYDNDTILGVTNTGSLNNSWNAKETQDVFLGIDNNNVCYHGLWGNIEYCYDKYINNTTSNSDIRNIGKLVESAYREIRGKASDETIASYLSNNLPDAAQNVDAEVKYFYPKTIAPNATNWNAGSIEQYQGNRKYHRKWLLGKRTKWFDAIYGADTIDSYKLTFKMEAASAEFESKIIKVYSEFDDWKFYWQAGDAGDLVGTNLLSKYDFTDDTKDNYGTITYNNLINSNVCKIKGLYVANKIDMSNWYGTTSSNYMSTINNGSNYQQLPYLKEWIIGSTLGNFYIGSSELKTLFVIGSDDNKIVLTPNLENLTIQNVTANTNGYFDVDFSSLTKLKTLNTSGTLLNATLPSGGVLQKLVLKKPTSLTFEDKINLNDLTIEDINVENYVIGNITVKHSSDYLYKWALSYLIVHQDINLTVVIGTGTDKDTLSSNTVSLLVQIANLISNGTLSKDKVKISGIGYYAEITKEQSSALYNVFGSDLIISSTASTVYTIDLDDGSDISEGGSLKVYPSLLTDVDDNGVPKYTLTKVSGDDTLFSLLSIDSESSPYLCILKAGTINDNVNRECTFTVTGICGGQSKTSDNITAKCTPIGSIELTLPNVTNNIVDSETLVKIKLDSGCTKSHLINKTYLTSGNISIESTSGTINTSDLELSEGFKFTPAENSDSTITVSLTFTNDTDSTTDDTISDSINIFYDIKVADLVNQAVTTEGLIWLNDLFDGYMYSFDNDRIMRSDLSKFTISTNGTSITSSGTIQGESISKSIQIDENRTNNLTAVSYFKTSSTTFTIPSGIKFTNLSIPEDVEGVNWTSIYPGYTGYETITFPSTVNKVCVNLTSYETSSGNLLFDLSNNKNITKIYNAGVTSASGLTNTPGVFHLNLVTLTSTDKYPNHILFKYNKNIDDDGVSTPCYITQIGNYYETIGSNVTDSTIPTAMFNITEATMGSQYSSLYSLGSPTNSNLVIGAISSYYMQTSPILWSGVQSYVTGLYYTFYKGNTDTTAVDFSKLKFIGDGTFTNNTKLSTLSLGSNLLTVGLAAFEGFTGILRESSSSSKVNLSNIVNIYARGFDKLSNSFEFILGKNEKDYPSVIKTIGSSAFTTSSSDINHTINIYTNTKIANIGDTPFGSSKRNTVKLYSTNQEVKDQFLTYKDSVNLYINDSLQS